MFIFMLFTIVGFQLDVSAFLFSDAMQPWCEGNLYSEKCILMDLRLLVCHVFVVTCQ
jgi:hypothetical protein